MELIRRVKHLERIQARMRPVEPPVITILYVDEDGHRNVIPGQDIDAIRARSAMYERLFASSWRDRENDGDDAIDGA